MKVDKGMRFVSRSRQEKIPLGSMEPSHSGPTRTYTKDPNKDHVHMCRRKEVVILAILQHIEAVTKREITHNVE